MEKKRTLKDWVIATRPWALPASVMPILIIWGFLYASTDGSGDMGTLNVNWLNALLCLPLLSIVHSGGNMVSDYFDFTKGVDRKECINGVTWIRDGKFRPQVILRYGLALLAVALPIGLFLLYNSSWSAAWVGVAGMLLALIYPWMKAHYLGDVNILISFALLPAVGTCFVAVGNYEPQSMLIILPIGLLTVSILHANNTRDVRNDSEAGLDTICNSVRLTAAKAIYAFELTAPYLLTVLYIVLFGQPWTLLMVLLSTPLAARNIRKMLHADDALPNRGITTLDKDSAQLQMAFGLLFTLGFCVGQWLGL